MMATAPIITMEHRKQTYSSDIFGPLRFLDLLHLNCNLVPAIERMWQLKLIYFEAVTGLVYHICDVYNHWSNMDLCFVK